MHRETAGRTEGHGLEAQPPERALVSAAWAQFEQITKGAGVGGSSFRQGTIDRTHGLNRPAFCVPGYRILGEIHRGGQGVVYQAIQESTRRKTAIKVLKEGPFADRAELARFEREVDVLSRLDHPHIVGIHDRGLTAGHVYYVMDYIAGQSLDAYAAGADLSLDEILILFAKICDAVNVAHLRGVIHRDLKPGNIRIDEEGQPRILDFGLAKLVQEAAEKSSARGMTMTGQFVGSLPWASPEQVGAGCASDRFPRAPDIDIRTDVYSLGVILYQLVTGRFPYPVSGRIDDVVRQITQTSPVRPSSIRQDLDRDVETVILKCLSKEPEHRYQSAGDLARDVRHFLANEPILATPPSTGYRLRKFARRNRGLVAAGVVIGATLLIASGVSIAFGVREARARGATETALRRAEAAERETKARMDELAQVASFQEAQLSGVDAQAMGVGMRRALLESARTAAKRSEMSPVQVTALIKKLEDGVADTDFTGIALKALNDNFFRPALKAINGQFGDQPLVKARLLQTLASTLQDVGLQNEAVGPQEEALSLRRQLLGDEHLDTLTSIDQMGVVLYGLGRLSEAERYWREALATRRRIIGEDDSATIDSIGNLGSLLKAQGKLADAEPYFREALEKSRRVLGDDDPKTLVALYNLGNLLDAQGKFAEAEPYFRDTLARRRRVLGEDHRDTIASLSTVAGLLQSQGKLTEAEPYYREALTQHRRVLGDDHPRTIQSIHDIGMLLHLQGRLLDAEPYYREALERRRRVNGDRHADTLSNINNLGLLLKSQGRLEEAETLYREALEKRRTALGEGHSDTLNSLNNLGALLLAQGKLKAAEGYFREALEKYRRVLGNEHVHTMTSINNVGNILLAQGRLSEAEPYYREALETRRRVLGADHTDTLVTMNNLAVMLRTQGKLEEAETLVREAMEQQRRKLGETHPNTLASIGNLGAVLQAQGRFAEAVELLVPIEPTVRKSFTGANVLRVARYLTPLGRARVGLGEFVAAEANLSESYAILEKATGVMETDRMATINGLVELYDAWHAAEPDKGYDAKAAEWREKLSEFQASTQPAAAAP